MNPCRPPSGTQISLHRQVHARQPRGRLDHVRDVLEVPADLLAPTDAAHRRDQADGLIRLDHREALSAPLVSGHTIRCVVAIDRDGAPARTSGAPPLWQTLAWMARPAAFMRAAASSATATRSRSARTGPRSRWCCSRTPTRSARSSGSIRRSRPPGRAGSSCVRSPGEHSILLLDGDEHLRERRLLQGPFHGERMRALAPVIAELAQRELCTLERARGRARADARADARDHPAGRVRRRGDDDERRGCARSIESALATVRSLPQILGDGAGPARPRAAEPVGPLPGRGRALRRGAARAARAPPAPTAGAATRCSACCSSSATSTATRRPTATSATSSSRCWSAATTARPRRWRGRSSGSRAIPRFTRGCARATRRTSTRSSRRCCARGPALTIAPRLLLEPVRIAGHDLPAGVQVAACLWLAMRREDLWPQAGGVPARALARRARRPTRCPGSRSAAACGAAPARRSPRWRCARCCAPRPT